MVGDSRLLLAAVGPAGATRPLWNLNHDDPQTPDDLLPSVDAEYGRRAAIRRATQLE